MGSRQLVVSIDFGTTYSGLAWAESSRADVQQVIDKWPARNTTKSSPKVPTELRAISSGHQWGFQIPASAKRSKYFKLKLDGSAQIGDNSQSPEELARIYLSHLHQHLMSTLRKQLSASVVTSTPIQFVLTVPAIWSDAAMKKTETAAEQAGFRGSRKIRLVTEPEAAAIYTLRNLGSQTLSVGKTFVVCDAGGGTVDLISYTIEQISPSLRVKEAVRGTGAKCGSSMLNQRFRRYLKQKLGDTYWTVDRLAEATDIFEEFKKTFTQNSEPLLINVALADDAAKNIRRGRLRIPHADMKKQVFEPIIKDVIDEVKDQIRLAQGNVAAVLMVGGFGASEYLRARIDAAVGPSIKTIQPANGWTAVVRGAAIMGLQSAGGVLSSGIDVSARIARKHYGTELIRKYEKGRDDISQRFWYAKWGEYAVSSMRWFVNKVLRVRGCDEGC
ncbi:hypothetical protein NX059_009643 [Plenodomus lindquistii]|nr:hypothetical protein NX059_009643 [Plenodomus lindquistii]